MRPIPFVLLLAACAPGASVQSPTPVAPAVRLVGAERPGGVVRLVAALPAPSYILVLAEQGADRPVPLALSIATDRQLPGGEHLLVAHQAAGDPRQLSSCGNPEIRMQAIFPTGAGTTPIRSLSEPPQPPAAGPVPVLVRDPAGDGCPVRMASPPQTIHLLLLAAPAEPESVGAALANLPPEVTGSQAVQLVARALGATAVATTRGTR